MSGEMRVTPNVAGRELDAEIARVVDGWTCIHEPRAITRDEAVAAARSIWLQEYSQEAPAGWEGDWAMMLDSDYPPKVCAKCGVTDADPSLHRRLPPYSTSIAAAWPLLAKVSGDYHLSISGGGDIVRVKLDDYYDVLVDVTAETVELAICRAALAAVAAGLTVVAP